MKKCATCGVVKPLDAFPALSSALDGRACGCRQCVITRYKRWVKVHGPEPCPICLVCAEGCHGQIVDDMCPKCRAAAVVQA